MVRGMQSERRVLGAAEVRWNDYVGTAAADDADAVLDRPSLYRLAGVDRGRYTIVAVDLAVREAVTTVTVYAVDRVGQDLPTPADIDARGRERGGIPVVAFVLPSQAADEFLNDAFKAILLRLVARAVGEHDLVVVPQVD